jgi:hypothetical protein
MPVEPNPAWDEGMKANGEETLSRTFARHEVIDEITSCLTPDEQKALAKGAAYPRLPVPYASRMGIAD